MTLIDAPAWSAVTSRQARVLETLLDAGRDPLASDAIARLVDLPAGGLQVTLRSLQQRGLVHAVRATPQHLSGWSLTPQAVRVFAERGEAEGAR